MYQNLGNADLVQLPHIIGQQTKAESKTVTCPVVEMGPDPTSRHSPHSTLEQGCLISPSTYEKMNGYRKQERKEKSQGKIQGEEGTCWALRE